MKILLSVQDLHVSSPDKEILKGVSLSLAPGKIYALMGPNGSGKSTLANTLAGHPSYRITHGEIFLKGKNISHVSPEIRAKQGLFLSFQYPKSIPGVSITNFLRMAYKAVKKKDLRVFEFQKKLKNTMDLLEIPSTFMERSVNEGFSGGEKKKMEILQAMILEPQVMILDETDSGLDIDALRIVAEGIKKLIKKDTTILLITHYYRILKYLSPDHVFIMQEGNIVESGGKELAARIEESGFGSKTPLLTILD